MSTRTVVLIAGLMVAAILGLIVLSLLAADQVPHTPARDPVLVISAAQYDSTALGTREAVLERRLRGAIGLPRSQEQRQVVRAFGAEPAGDACRYLRVDGTTAYVRLCFSPAGRLTGKLRRTP